MLNDFRHGDKAVLSFEQFRLVAIIRIRVFDQYSPLFEHLINDCPWTTTKVQS